MAAPSQPAPQSDHLTARRTLRFLGNELRTKQFQLKSVLRRRKQAEYDETETRKAIAALMRRIQREIDANPGLFKGLVRDDEGEEG